MPKRRGNIETRDGPDPFPKTGWVKQFEPFIRQWVGDFCRDYPGAEYENYLVYAVQIAVEAEPKFKSELAGKGGFATFIWKPLLRLSRIYEHEQNQIKIPGPTKEDRERERAEENGEPINPIVYRGGNGARIAIDRQWITNGSCRHRVVIGLQLRSSDETSARAAVEELSTALDKLLDDRPLAVIRGDIQDAIGNGADIQFYKGRKPPNFHKWPSRVDFTVSFDQIVCRDDDGKPLTYCDVIPHPSTAALNIPGFGGDTDVDRLRAAIEAERPFLSPNERRVLDWKIGGSGRLSHWAAQNGISKGYTSKLNQRIDGRLADRMKKS